MMDQAAFSPKISVIVPVYNCEAYVGRCLESILAQDYRNIEVIVIDDGSTDASTGICRAFAALDKRIVLLRQDNRGLSAARNAGLDSATGDYVTFVDGDDFIDHDMLSQYVNCLENSRNELVISGYRYLRNGKILGEYVPQHRALGREEALEELYRDETFRNFMCNKLYKRTLFEDIRFPEGKVYEDVRVQYRLFEKASYIMKCQFCGYNYVQHPESITCQNNLSHKFDYINAHLERVDCVSVKSPALIQNLALGIYRAYVELVNTSLSNPNQRRILRARREAVDMRLRNLMPTIGCSMGYRRYIIALGVHGTMASDILIGNICVLNKVFIKFMNIFHIKMFI